MLMIIVLRRFDISHIDWINGQHFDIGTFQMYSERRSLKFVTRM